MKAQWARLSRWLKDKGHALYDWERTLIERRYSPKEYADLADFPRARRSFRPADPYVPGAQQPYLDPLVTGERVSRSVIELLEKRMRPNAWSEAGFLGAGESLVDVVRQDDATLAARKVTHAELVRALRTVLSAAVDDYRKRPVSEEIHRDPGYRFVARLLWSKAPYRPLRPDEFPDVETGGRHGALRAFFLKWQGAQRCPWGDRESGVYDFALLDTRSGEYVTMPELVLHLIERHHFFEGYGTRYRTDPVRLMTMLDLGGGATAD